jgi:VWFA-related protein
MAYKLTASLLGATVLGVLLASTTSTAQTGAEAQEGLKRTFYVSVLAKDGTPIDDMTAADFEVKEGGKTQTLTSAKLSSTPLRVHVIVSDGGTGAFQAGVLRLANSLLGRAEFAFTSVMVQPDRILDFTNNVQQLGTGIEKLGRRGAAQGNHQLMDAIVAAIKDIAAPGKHPVLIVLRIGFEDPSTIRANSVRDALRKSGATMYVVSRTGASRAAPTYAGTNAMTPEAAQRQMDDAERADTALALNLVLGDGSRDSGGYQQEINLTTAIQTMEQLANEIKNQYEISYTLPAGTKPSDRLQVTTKRKNVTLRAPQRIAN